MTSFSIVDIIQYKDKSNNDQDICLFMSYSNNISDILS